MQERRVILMAVRIEVSQEIDRPVPIVFKFFADDHVRNHPRWDPYIELWRTSDEPIGVGTIIHRRNSRSGTTPVEGTMEVVEYEPNRAMGAVVREGVWRFTEGPPSRRPVRVARD